MSGFLLATNVPSELIRPQPEGNVRAWLAAQQLDQLWISVVSFGEFRKGIELRRKESVARSLKAGWKTIFPPCFQLVFSL